MAKTLVGVFDDVTSAQNAVRGLQAEGIKPENVRLMDNGGAAGGAAGGASADVSWTEKVADWFSSLVDDDSDKPHAEHYSEAVRRGHYLVVADVESTMVDRATAVLNRFGTVDLNSRVDQWKRSGYSGSFDRTAKPFSAEQRTKELATYQQGKTETAGKEAIPVVQEELEVGKRIVQRGGVRVHSYVEEHPVEEVVRLRNERINVQRHAVNRSVNNADLAFKERTVDVKAMGEEAVVAKHARVVEEVVVGKEMQSHDETIKETVRRKDVSVEAIPADTKK